MSSGRKCKNCGSLDIEVDPGRGDAVCTNCGSVLEDNIIVAEIQFEENAHGTSNALGQFVSAESKGGPTNFGAAFHVGMGIESREITLKKARNGITNLCNQLRLNQHCIDTACNFFKMALARNLTRGRRNTHMYAACVYITCRTEGTPHMLIDISDVLQICCYELGRTYLRVSQALCINVPSLVNFQARQKFYRRLLEGSRTDPEDTITWDIIKEIIENLNFNLEMSHSHLVVYIVLFLPALSNAHPCLYILRFAAKLEFEGKTQEVANTALRLVQRMKRDSIHSGRRPSGLCGAALLMAARLHDFNRTTSDIVKIVKVHESTLRKRLIEFGDTPSSALTLDEFMTVDLEEDQDPPSFKAARKKDKERLQKLMEEEADNLTELQKDIEIQLDSNGKRRVKNRLQQTVVEQTDTKRFINESTVGTITKILQDENVDDPVNAGQEALVKELGPNIASMGLANSLDDTVNIPLNTPTMEIDLTFDNIDDEELDAYIMDEDEVQHKSGLWHKLNATYLEQQKIKEEKLKKEKEEGKPEKKKRRNVRKKQTTGPASSAGEAIEKMLQEKKVSSKINYEVLKSLTAPKIEEMPEQTLNSENHDEIPKRRRSISVLSNLDMPPAKRVRASVNITSRRGKGKAQPSIGLPFVESVENETKLTDIKKDEKPEPDTETVLEDECEEDYEDEAAPVEPEMGVLQMLRQYQQNESDEAEEIFGLGLDDEYY